MPKEIIIPEFLVTNFFDIKWKLTKNKKEQPAYTFLDMPGIDYVIRYLKSCSSPKCLDLGCGDGRYALIYAQKAKARVLAVDISSQAIQRVKERAKLLGVQQLIRAQIGDISEFDYLEEYDLISANNALHYFSIPQIKKIIREIKGHTKKGGLNYIIFEAEIEMVLSNGQKIRFANQKYRTISYMQKILKDLYSDWEIKKVIKTKINASSTFPKKFQEILKKYLPNSFGDVSDKYNRKFKELTIIAKKLK